MQGPMASAFPTVVSSDYLPVWKEFLKTRQVSDIRKKYKGLSAKYYTCMGFVSYIQSIDKKSVRKTDVTESTALYSPSVAYRELMDFAARKRLITDLNLRRASHEFSISADESDFIRALVDPECEGHITYHVQGKQPLDKLLPRLTPTLFKTVPYEFRSYVKGKKKTFQRADKQLSSQVGWVCLLSNDRLFLEMARCQFGTVVLRYRFTVPGLFFYGKSQPASIQKLLRKRHEQAVIVP